MNTLFRNAVIEHETSPLRSIPIYSNFFLLRNKKAPLRRLMGEIAIESPQGV